MKKTFLFIFILAFPLTVFAQRGIYPDVSFTLDRIENAFRTGNPMAIEDLIPSGITMRLADTLYQSTSDIQAMNALNQFFKNKSNIDFVLTPMGTGTMMYTENGKRDTTNVDVYLGLRNGQVFVYALNISNYPTVTMFYDIPRKKKGN